MQAKSQERSASKKPCYGRPSVPPNLFTEKKPKTISLRKRITLTVTFAIVSFMILFYPQRVTVTVEGKTVPAITYSVDVPVSGRVVKITQTEGASVKAGEVIAVLQSDVLNNKITQQEKEVEILKSQLEKAELEFRNQSDRVETYRIYLEVGTMSQSELKEVEHNFAKAQAEVNQLLHRLEKGRSALRYLRTLKEMETIKAPDDGVILSDLRNKQGMFLSQGEEIFRLASHAMALEFLVTEDRAQHITPGAEVKVRFMSDPFKTHTGSVTKLDEKVDEKIERMWLIKNVIRVTAQVDDPLPLSPGMKARAEIKTRSKTNLARKIAAHLFL